MAAGSEGGADFWSYVVVVGGALAAVAARAVHSWREADIEEKPTKGSKVVLERADLVDISATERRLAETNRAIDSLGPRLERLYDLEQINKGMLEGNRERMDEVLRVMRRMELELDVAKRVREERAIAATRHLEADKDA